MVYSGIFYGIKLKNGKILIDNNLVQVYTVKYLTIKKLMIKKLLA